MKIKASALAALVLLTLVAQSATAALVGGYNLVTVPANSDVHLTIPFNGNIFEDCTVTAVSGTTLTVDTSMTANAYAGTFYVRFTGGSADGLWSAISGNGTSDVVLADANVAAEVSVGDTLRVYEHHTIAQIFPNSLKGFSFNDSTSILIYENNIDSPEQNKSAAGVVSYLPFLSSWFGGAGGNTILAPETQFVLRNDSAEELVFIGFGVVPDHSVSMLVTANNDQLIGTGYPVPVALTGSGLEGDGRNVLIMDNTTSEQNRSASIVANYLGFLSQWLGAGLNQTLAPSESFILRLPASDAGTRVTINKPY